MFDILLRMFAGLIRLLPRSVSLLFGVMLADLLYYVVKLRKQVGLDNLKLAFPDKSDRDHRQILHAAYRHFGKALFDFIRMPHVMVEHLPDLFILNDEPLKSLQEQGQGAVLVSGHFGNWEYMNRALGLKGYQVAGMFVEQHGIGGKMLGDIRAQTGSQLFGKKASPRAILRSIKSGSIMGIASDQDAKKRGHWHTFFGQPASRPRGPAVFALQSNAPMIYAHCLLGADNRYSLECWEIGKEDLPDDKEQAIDQLNQRFHDALESQVRLHPEQYFWFHRMWKTKPES
ncbi:lysophospholipid acyltransferase family protein [Candidatus Neomarinimicrobiota bacterium]